MGFVDAVSKSFETMQNTIARPKLAVHAPDVIVDISRNAGAVYEFHKRGTSSK